MTGDLRIRVSMLPSFADCERRAVARAFSGRFGAYGYEIRELPPMIGAVVGTAAHAGAAFTMAQKIEGRGLGNQAEAIDRAQQELKQGMSTGIVFDDATDSRAGAQEQVRRMVMSYRTHLAPRLEPTVVETRFECDFDGIVVSGQMDLLTVEQNEAVRDLKTGTRARANHAQVGAYGLIRRSHGANVTALYEDFVQRVPVKKEQPPPVTVQYDQGMAEWSAYSILKRARDAFQAFEEYATRGTQPPETAFLANPSSMLCGPKWCPAHGTPFCREHRERTK